MNSHHFIKTRFIIIAISGVSTLGRTPGIGSTLKCAQVRDQDIGGCKCSIYMNLISPPFYSVGWQFGNIISSFLEDSMTQELLVSC